MVKFFKDVIKLSLKDYHGYPFNRIWKISHPIFLFIKKKSSGHYLIGMRSFRMCKNKTITISHSKGIVY